MFNIIIFTNLIYYCYGCFFIKGFTYKFISIIFFPLIAKKISPFFISLELICAFFKVILEDNFFSSDSSLRILNFKLFDKDKFFILIAFKIIFLSEKKIFFTPIS